MGAIAVEAARDLTDDLLARDWQEYADACTCHDRGEPVVCHARDLTHAGELVVYRLRAVTWGSASRSTAGLVLAGTASTS